MSLFNKVADLYQKETPTQAHANIESFKNSYFEEHLRAATSGATFSRYLFSNKTQSQRFDRPKACNFIKKEALAQVLSSEICENFNKPFFIEHL